MRRADREICDPTEIAAILNRAAVCHLGLIDGDWPYVVPVSFAYDAGVLYVHSATEGHKIDLLRADPRVCFEVEADVAILPGETACAFGMRYRSVIGRGVARFVEAPADRAKALDLIMAHYGAPGPHAYDPATLARVTVLAIDVVSLTAKGAHLSE